MDWKWPDIEVDSVFDIDTVIESVVSVLSWLREIIETAGMDFLEFMDYNDNWHLLDNPEAFIRERTLNLEEILRDFCVNYTEDQINNIIQIYSE